MRTDDVDWSKPEHAKALALNSKIASDSSRELCLSVVDRVKAHEDRKYGRSGKADSHLNAVAAIVGGLLRTASSDLQRWSYRSMGRDTFTGEHVSYRTFKGAYDPMVAAGLIEFSKGYYERNPFTGENGEVINDGRGRATRLRATTELLSLAQRLGITPTNTGMHFGHSLPKHPLVLKKSKTSKAWKEGEDIGRSGKKMAFKHDNHTSALEADIKELNTFLDEDSRIEGGNHFGYRRIFNQGDLPEFAWNKGGRLYSLGEDSYQRLKKDDRLRMRLNDEPVVEIDIRASFLTILYARSGETLDMTTDPYFVEGIPRPMVKQWVTMTMGHTKFHKRWPREAAKDLKKKGCKVGGRLTAKKVGEKVLARHPILADWPDQKLSCFDLMYLESEAVVRTMLKLKRSHGIPCLSVHDSIIVPVTASELAQETLSYFYFEATGVEPAMVVKQAS